MYGRSGGKNLLVMCIGLLILAFEIVALRAQNLFLTVRNDDPNILPQGLTIGDFNNDGVLDLALLKSSGFVSIYLIGENGDLLADGKDFPAGPDPVSIVSADFNGDERLDLAIINRSSSTVSVLFGDGLGGFSEPILTNVGEHPFAITSGDFNNDGALDLAIAHKQGLADSYVSILLGNGHGGFTPIGILPVDGIPKAIMTADFNNDNNPDLALHSEHPHRLSILIGDGQGNFFNDTSVNLGSSQGWMTLGDFSVDQKLVFAVASRSPCSCQSTFKIFLGDNTIILKVVATLADVDPDEEEDLHLTSGTELVDVNILTGVHSDEDDLFITICIIGWLDPLKKEIGGYSEINFSEGIYEEKNILFSDYGVSGHDGSLPGPRPTPFAFRYRRIHRSVKINGSTEI